RVSVEDFMREYPHLEADHDAVCELILGEYQLLVAMGEAPSWDRFLERFTRYAEQLELERAYDQFADVLAEIPGGESISPDTPGNPNCQPSESREPPDRRFTIVKLHAKGGLGEVYLAHDHELRRKVALKRIQQLHANRPNERLRFLQEAEIIGSLQHPGIVP